MRARIFGLLLITTAGFSLGGCAMARHIMVDGNGGVIAIPRNIDLHRERADAMMMDHCPNGYTVLHEKEVVVGSTTREDHQTEYTESGEEGASVTTTRDKTEWRITYQCN